MELLVGHGHSEGWGSCVTSAVGSVSTAGEDVEAPPGTCSCSGAPLLSSPPGSCALLAEAIRWWEQGAHGWARRFELHAVARLPGTGTGGSRWR